MNRRPRSLSRRRRCGGPRCGWRPPRSRVGRQPPMLCRLQIHRNVYSGKPGKVRKSKIGSRLNCRVSQYDGTWKEGLGSIRAWIRSLRREDRAECMIRMIPGSVFRERSISVRVVKSNGQSGCKSQSALSECIFNVFGAIERRAESCVPGCKGRVEITIICKERRSRDDGHWRNNVRRPSISSKSMAMTSTCRMDGAPRKPAASEMIFPE